MRISINIKLAFGFVLLVLVTSGVIGGLFYIKTTDILVSNTLDLIEDDVQTAGTMLKRIVSIRDEDVLFLANTPPIQGMLRTKNVKTQDGSTYEQWEKRLTTIFKAQLKRKKSYVSIRYIDSNGKELVHTRRDSNKIIASTREQLQNKSERIYVKKSLSLPEGKVYVSEINLNREFGKVVIPKQPVIRSVTSIYDKKNNKYAGLISITAEISEELNRLIKQIKSNEESSVYITNDHGGYLVHPDKTIAFGFDLEKRYRIQEDFPQLAPFYLPDSPVKTVTLLPSELNDKYVVNFTKISFDPENKDRFIAVVIRQNYQNIVKAQSELLKDVLAWSVILVILAVITGVLYSLRISRPLKNISSLMDKYSSKRISTVDLPVDQDDEIGILANSFKTMIDEVEEVKANLENTVKRRTYELNQFKTTLDETLDCVFMFRPDTLRFFYVNAGAMQQFGYTYDEMIGLTAYDITPKITKSELHAVVEKFVKGEQESTNFETLLAHKEGHTIPVEVFLQYIHPKNEPARFVAIVRDITERKQMDKLKNEFISTVSHELRTPLTSIKGAISLLASDVVGKIPESAKDMIKIAGNNAERLLVLINDLLDIQKIESGKMDFDFQKHDLIDIVEQAVIENAEYGKQYNVAFEITQKIDNAVVYADKDRLMQVLSNLLSNAAKFSNENDKVEVSVNRDNDSLIRICVEDHGQGIPEDFYPKVFEKFTQSDSSDTRIKGGTGLGLSISKVIMEKHGGNIGFTSKLGSGTIFYVEIPAMVESN